MGRVQTHISRERDQRGGEVGSQQHHHRRDYDEKLLRYARGRLQVRSRVDRGAEIVLQDAFQGKQGKQERMKQSCWSDFGIVWNYFMKDVAMQVTAHGRGTDGSMSVYRLQIQQFAASISASLCTSVMTSLYLIIARTFNLAGHVS